MFQFKNKLEMVTLKYFHLPFICFANYNSRKLLKRPVMSRFMFNSVKEECRYDINQTLIGHFREKQHQE